MTASRILLSLLIKNFAPTGALVFAIDDTIERRRGERITAKGIYRDPVRSSHSHFVKGERTAVALPDADCDSLGEAKLLGVAGSHLLVSVRALLPRAQHPHKKLTEWARQMLLQVKRWLPEREMVVVADSSFAALELLAAVRRR